MISGVSSYSSYYTGSTLARTQTAASSTTGTQTGNCGGAQGAAKFQEDLFKSIDGDGDGNISKDELTSALSSSDDSDSSIDVDDLLAQLDSDGSGGVSQDELSAAMPPPPPPGGMGGPGGAGGSSEDLVSSLDSNGDGVISADELAAAGQGDDSDSLSQLFAQLDADGSGGISSDELTSAFQAHGQGDGPPPPPQANPSGGQSSEDRNTSVAYQKLVANLLKQYQSSEATTLQAPSGSLVNIAA